MPKSKKSKFLRAILTVAVTLVFLVFIFFLGVNVWLFTIKPETITHTFPQKKINSSPKKLNNYTNDSEEKIASLANNKHVKEIVIEKDFLKSPSKKGSDWKKIHQFLETLVWSASFFEYHPDFDPCNAVCNSSQIKLTNFESIPDSYEEFGEAAILDPEFNKSLLFMSNLLKLFPREFIKFIQNYSESPNLFIQTVRSTQIISIVKKWRSETKAFKKDVVAFGRKIDKYGDLVKACGNEEIDEVKAKRLCYETFN